MLAKVKLTQDIGRWRVEGRTVIHQSWAGYTWRKKGSDLAYYEGCTFPSLPPAPPPPPPPPAVPVFWEICVDAYEPMPFTVVIIFSCKRFDEVRGEFTHRFEQVYEGVEIPMMTVEIVSVSYDSDSLTKVYHIFFGPPSEPFLEDYVTLSVPPFNGLPLATPNIDHEQYVVS